MFGRTEKIVLAGIRTARRLNEFVQQTGAVFHAQDSGHGFVEAGHGDRAVVYLPHGCFKQTFPVIRHHVDIEAGEQRLRTVGIGAASDLAVAVPVTHHEAVEAQFVAQHAGQQRFIAVHFAAVDRVEAGHDRFHTRPDGSGVGGSVDLLQLLDIAGHFALVDTLIGPAVAEEVLGSGNDMACAQPIGITLAPLQAFDQRSAQRRDDLRILGIAFIGPAPAIILRHCDGGREVPVDPGDFDLGGGGFADAAYQIGVACRAKADIVREDRSPHHIGMAMHGIGAPHRGDDRLTVRLLRDRGEIHLVRELQPFAGFGIFIAIGAAVAAIEIAAETIAAHVFGSEAVNLRLDQLGDLALHAHAGDQIGDAGIFSSACGAGGRRFHIAWNSGAPGKCHRGGRGHPKRFHNDHPSPRSLN